MNFDFSDEQKALREELRRVLAETCPPRAVRAVLESRVPLDRALWERLGALGWAGTAIPEEHGGAGAGYLDLCIVAEELGRALAPVPFSSSVYLASEAILRAGSAEQKRKWLPQLAAGKAIGTFALAEGARVPTAATIEARFADGALTGTKLPVPDGGVADLAVVLARSGRDLSLVLVELDQPGVARTTVETVDPSRGHARLVFDGARAEPLGAAGEGWFLTETLLDRAAVLLAFEQLGGAQRALEMARDYALDRYAFGRPIGSFQAIKHKLADVYIATELARSNCYYGAWALSTDASELPVAAAAARVAASEAFWQAAKENVQTHGGNGFTWEFDCHLYYRRAKLLAQALGSQRRWKDRLVARLETRNAA